MTQILRCFALALALPLGALNAQETAAVAPGTRVRVQNDETLHNYRVIGTLESIDSSTIVVLKQEGDTVKVPRRPSTRLDVSAGPGVCGPDNRGACVAIGFLGGAGLGALVGAIASNGPNCSDEPCALAYLVTVPLGALVGTVVGLSVGGEHWRRAEIPARLSIGPDGSGRLALGLSVPF
jgi:hypothetical protein